MNTTNGLDHISASQIHTWLYCQRSYHFKYDLKLPQASSCAMSRGKIFHERIAKALQEGKEPKLPKKWLANYRAIAARINFSDKLLVEEKVETDIDGYNILGYIDVIDYKKRLIVDWKFGKKVSKYNVQGYLYKRLVKEIYGIDCDVAFCFIPSLSINPMYPADYADGESIFNAFIERPQDSIFKFYPGSRKCQMCGYYMYCMNPKVLKALG